MDNTQAKVALVIASGVAFQQINYDQYGLVPSDICIQNLFRIWNYQGILVERRRFSENEA